MVVDNNGNDAASGMECEGGKLHVDDVILYN